jgi:hypothetical protein
MLPFVIFTGDFYNIKLWHLLPCQIIYQNIFIKGHPYKQKNVASTQPVNQKLKIQSHNALFL